MESQTRYKCSLCAGVFRQKANLVLHWKQLHMKPDKKTQEPPTTYTRLFCSICQAYFATRISLTRHYKQTHNDHLPHKCVTCGKGFKQSFQLRSHRKTVHSTGNIKSSEITSPNRDTLLQMDTSSQVDTLFQEDTSSQVGNSLQVDTLSPVDTSAKVCISPQLDKLTLDTSWQSNTDNSKNSVNDVGSDPISCIKCNKTFATINCLTRHYKTIHTDYRTHKCPLCGYGFKFNSNLMVHMKRSHGETYRSGNSTVSSINTQKDEASLPTSQSNLFVRSSEFSCNICEATFRTRNFIACHYKMVHEDDRPYKCQKCGQEFKQLAHLNYHRKSVHRENINSGSEMDTIESEDARIPCSKCDSTFESDKTLARHCAITHKNNQPHECQICGYTFTQIPNLIVHMKRSHGKYSRNESNTEPHIRTHGNQRTFRPKPELTCITCGASFATKYSLTRHYRVMHKDYLSQKCIICGQGFKHSLRLSIHMDKSHQIEEHSHAYICTDTIVHGEGKPEEILAEIIDEGEQSTHELDIIKIEEPTINFPELALERTYKRDYLLPAETLPTPSLEANIKIKQIKRQEGPVAKTDVEAAEYRAPIIIYYDC